MKADSVVSESMHVYDGGPEHLQMVLRDASRDEVGSRVPFCDRLEPWVSLRVSDCVFSLAFCTFKPEFVVY